MEKQSLTSHNNETTPRFIYLLTVLAAVGGFLFGYDTGVISGAMLLLKPAFNLNSRWQECIVSITIASAAIFSLFGGYMSDAFGRRPVIFLSSIVFTVGAVLLGVAQNRIMLVIGRFVVGAGIGLASMTVPMYIAEASPSHLRGRLVTVNCLFITGGQFVAALLDGAFSYVGPDGWRYMLGLAALPSAVQFIGFCFMPESPRWLIENDKYENAKIVLYRIHGSKEKADQEFENIKQAFEEDKKERLEKGGRFIVLTMLTTPHLRRALIVGCGLLMFQQLSGINTIMYYAATIIRMSGVKSTQMAIWLDAMTAGVNFTCTFIGVYLVDRIGRRPLAIGSLLCTTVSLLVLAIGFSLMAHSSPMIPFQNEDYQNYDHCRKAPSCDSCIHYVDCGYCFYDNSKFLFNGSCLPADKEMTEYSLIGRCNVILSSDDPLTWAYDWCPNHYAWLIIMGLVLYLFAFAPGMGTMPWTINSEIYPQWARSTGNALATSTCWIFNLLVSVTFLSLMEAITKQGAYYLYAAVAFIGVIFFFLFLPETKGESLEELENIFAQPWFTSEQNRGCFGPGLAIRSKKYNKTVIDESEPL